MSPLIYYQLEKITGATSMSLRITFILGITLRALIQVEGGFFAFLDILIKMVKIHVYVVKIHIYLVKIHLYLVNNSCNIRWGRIQWCQRENGIFGKEEG